MGSDSQGKCSPRQTRHYINLRLYEARILPHFSWASLIGMTLFVVYCGSALISMVPRASSGSRASAYARAQEIAACAALHNVAPASCYRSANSTRTIYMQPYGALGSRLRGTASALTLARDLGVNVVIVWQDSEFGFTGPWHELFSEPRLPLGCFPGQALRPEYARCKVHTVNSLDEWTAVKDSGWERVRGRGGSAQEVLCLKSVMYLTPKQRDIGWFYQSLVPAQSIMAGVQDFMSSHRWAEWGTWVGVHIRRTDLMLRCNTADCSDGVKVQDALPLSAYIDLMRQVLELSAGEDKAGTARFYIATDDPNAEEEIRRQLVQALAEHRRRRTGRGLLEQPQHPVRGMLQPGDGEREARPGVSGVGHGEMANTSVPAAGNAASATADVDVDGAELVVSYKKAVRDTSGDWLAMRSVTQGVQEAIADLYLLSRAPLLLGTVGSTFSQTAKLMGDPFFITVGVEFENRL